MFGRAPPECYAITKGIIINLKGKNWQVIQNLVLKTKQKNKNGRFEQNINK